MCGDEVFDLLLKIRATLYMKNINVDNNFKLHNFYLTLYNKKGKMIDQNLDYLKYCLKNCMDKDLITRLPMLMQNTYEEGEKKSKFKEMSQYKLNFISKIVIEDFMNEDPNEVKIQASDYHITFSLK